MGRFRFIICAFCFFYFCPMGIGDRIDSVVDKIYDKLNKPDIEDTFFSDTELLNLILSENANLFKKLAEDVRPDRTIAKVFFKLCQLVDPSFRNKFPEIQDFLLFRDNVVRYWFKIMSKLLVHQKDTYRCTVQNSYYQVDFVESSMSEEATSFDDEEEEDYYFDDSSEFY